MGHPVTPEQARTVRSLAVIGIMCAIVVEAILLALTGYFSNTGAQATSDACFYGSLLAAAIIVTNLLVLVRVPRPPVIPRIPPARVIQR
jgi:hypothetical protein